MKKLFYVIMGGAILIASSCKKDVSKDLEKSGPNAPAAYIDLTGVISPTQAAAISAQLADTTDGSPDQVNINGIVYLDSLATLTIPAGTTILGTQTACGVFPDLTNLANNKGTLVVRRGAKIIANGTPTNPIVWTSGNPIGSKKIGDWGGLVILGNAPISAALPGATSCSLTNSFEAFAAIPNGLNGYGGIITNDNSGSITYNRFEFGGGIVAAPNAEVNGLTLCGVGCGTTINHIEISNSADDGIEFLGGTVNVDHVLTFNTKDDDFDFDEGYQGTLQFIVAYRTNVADNSGSEMIEVDGNAAGISAANCRRTCPTILNATLVGPDSCNVAQNCQPSSGINQAGRFDAGIVIRREGSIHMANSYVITLRDPTAIVSTPTTCSRFINNISLSNDDSWIANTIFQFTTATPAVNDNDEIGPFAPFACNLSFDQTPGTCNSMINSLLAPGLSNSSLPDFNAFGLGGFLQNTAGSPGISGGLNAGGVTLGACSLPLFGTNERGGVPSTDVWTNSPWISIATK
jgi:hypothetical protein